MKAPNIEADRLANWAFANLTKGEGGEYPLQDVRLGLLPNSQGGLRFGGTLKINTLLAKKSRHSKSIPEPIIIQRELEEVSELLRKHANFVPRYFSHSVSADPLAEAVRRLTKLLVDLAGKDTTALQCLYDTLCVSLIDFENLSCRADSLRLVQAEASKQSMWPVLYSPHPRRKRELEKAMQKIGLGEHSFQKLRGARDTDKSPAGKFARRMGATLWIIYTVPGLKQLLRQPIGMNPKLCENEFLSKGWHLWMIRLCQLPELTNASAPAWFEVGWEALKDATSGNIVSVPELAKLGESNAAYGKTLGLKTGAQKSRATDQIKKLLRKAFLARFGNPL